MLASAFALRDWQGDVEGDAFVFVGGRDMALVALADAVGDGEAEAVAAGLAGARLIEAVEALEEVGDGVVVKGVALVVHSEVDAALLARQPHADDAFRRGVFAGVVEENADELLELRLVAAHDRGEDPIFRGAPCAVFACAEGAYDLDIVNCSIAVASLDLLLPTMGLGACWAGYAMRAAAPSRHIPFIRFLYRMFSVGIFFRSEKRKRRSGNRSAETL